MYTSSILNSYHDNARRCYLPISADCPFRQPWLHIISSLNSLIYLYVTVTFNNITTVPVVNSNSFVSSNIQLVFKFSRLFHKYMCFWTIICLNQYPNKMNQVYLLHARGGSRGVDIHGQDHQEALPGFASGEVGSGSEHLRLQLCKPEQANLTKS